ncbi:NXPE family member 3-like [Amphiura filiformis]|uniref:NXPE family member 3-like n=1 Tax=Amphiura filiformis TaxID=82378 RepID=UPI003B2242EF
MESQMKVKEGSSGCVISRRKLSLICGIVISISIYLYLDVFRAEIINIFHKPPHKPVKPPAYKKCTDVHQLPMVDGLTSLNESWTGWFVNGHAIELDESKHPHSQYLEKNKNLVPACPKYFDAFIKDPKPVYLLCDTIELIITARDCKKKRLNSGGDYLWTWIKTDSMKASQTQEGNITDVGNGTYIARFTLRWIGEVTPVVAVVRARQAMNYLRQWRQKVPARFCYDGIFKLKHVTATVPCHMTPWMNLNKTNIKVDKTRHLCNFTDPFTGIPWYCIKPPNMPCSAYNFGRGNLRREILYDNSKLYFKATKGLDYVKNIQPRAITVVNNIDKNHSLSGSFTSCEFSKTLPMCNSTDRGVMLSPNSASGFYYKNVWVSLQCKKSKFEKNKMIQILQNKTLIFFGDSTVRQWLEYITDTFRNDFCITKLGATKFRYSVRYNMTLTHTFHGFPIRTGHATAPICEYVANRIDALKTGGPDVIIVLTIWAHFTATSLEFYQDRLLSIKNAIIRFQKRYPGTRIFIKSANTREKGTPTMSNWYAWECDQVMRMMLGHIPGITIIDVWGMTTGHYTGFHVHPDQSVVRNEVDMLLSLI